MLKNGGYHCCRALLLSSVWSLSRRESVHKTRRPRRRRLTSLQNEFSRVAVDLWISHSDEPKICVVVRNRRTILPLTVSRSSSTRGSTASMINSSSSSSIFNIIVTLEMIVVAFRRPKMKIKRRQQPKVKSGVIVCRSGQLPRRSKRMIRRQQAKYRSD